MKHKPAGMAALVMMLFLLLALPAVSSAGSTETCDHDWELVKTVDATCTKAGKEYYKCSRCGKKKTKKIKALGHDWSYCTIVKKPTCTQDGLKRCVCSRNAKHVNEEAIPATGHKWSGWTIVKKSTAYEKGLQQRTCSKCRKKEERELPQLTADWIVPPDFSVSDNLLALFSSALNGMEGTLYTPVRFLASRAMVSATGSGLCPGMTKASPVRVLVRSETAMPVRASP